MSWNKPLVEEPSLVEIEPKQVQQGQQMGIGAQNNPMQAQPYVGQQYFQSYPQLQGYQLNQGYLPNQGANNQLAPPQPLSLRFINHLHNFCQLINPSNTPQSGRIFSFLNLPSHINPSHRIFVVIHSQL